VFDNDSNLWKLGNAYGGRRANRGSRELGPGMLKVALIDQTTDTLNTPDGVVETLLPKLEASYEYNFTDAMSMRTPSAATRPMISSTQVHSAAPTSFSVNSWMLGMGANLNFGPFFVKPQVSYYQNGAAAGWLGNDISPVYKVRVLSMISMVFWYRPRNWSAVNDVSTPKT
jgi:hypothetical protein